MSVAAQRSSPSALTFTGAHRKWLTKSAPVCDLDTRCHSRLLVNGGSTFRRHEGRHLLTLKSRPYFRSRAYSSSDRMALCITVQFKQCHSHVRCSRNCFRGSISPSPKIIQRVASMTALSDETCAREVFLGRSGGI